MKLKDILNEGMVVATPRDVSNMENRLRANSTLVKLLARINTSDELAQTLTTIMSLVDQTASYNKSKVLNAVRDQLKQLGSTPPPQI